MINQNTNFEQLLHTKLRINPLGKSDIYISNELIEIINPYFEKIDIKFDLTLKDLVFESETPVTFEKCSFKNLNIFDIKCKGLQFIDCVFETINISSNLNRVSIQGGTFKHFSYPVKSIRSIVIDGKNELIFGSIAFPVINDCQVTLKSLKVENIVIGAEIATSNLVYSKSIKLLNVKVNRLSLNNIENSKDILFKGLKPLKKGISELIATNSNLDDIKFSECDFENFKSLQVINSKLDGIKSEYNTWFKKIVKEDGKEDINAYRQLKAAMEEHYDSIGETYFRAMELNAHLKNLKGDKQRGERFMLYMNKWSNNHGLSWTRGLLFTISVTLLFFIFYLISLKNYPYSFGWSTTKEFGNSISFFIENFSKFFLISHGLDFIKETEPRGISYFIDVIGRIFIGYGIYQTVQAFRKYGK